MDFARKQLKKYGWSEGKGLGKDGNGISEPIKPKIKHSLTGVGYDPAADFTGHWWSTLYDKAASNLEVKNKNGKTKKIRRKSKEEFEITNSTWKLKRKKKDQKSEEEYSDFFVKTTLIGKGGENTTRIKLSDSESEDENDGDNIKMTDEELFAACNGRTAHKGARHGLRALGKLARVEQQEKILLQQTKYKGYSHHEKFKNSDDKDFQIIEEVSLHSDSETNIVKQKKKKKKRCKSTDKMYTDCDKILLIESEVTEKICYDIALNENEQLNRSVKLKTKMINCTQVEDADNIEIVKRKKKKLKRHSKEE